MLALVVAAAVGALAAAPSASAWAVDMTANTSFKRTYSWDIQKSVDKPTLTLGVGESATVTYSVTVTPSAPVESDWAVSGKVTISHDPHIRIDTLRVFGYLDETREATTTCVPAPPALITSGMTCDYAAALPDATANTALMRATVTDTSDGTTGHRTAKAPYSFANATITEIDECVEVTDSQQGTLGTVCASDGTTTFTYTRTIGPYSTCGDKVVSNTATSTTNDTATTDSSSANVGVTVTCGGCTLTIGYWKTHAGFGPQADAVSPLLPISLGTSGGARTLNVTTAGFAVQLLSMNGSNNVSDASNGINKLYAQLLAAKLNAANGADTSGISSTIAAADAFLANHNSTSWSSLSKAQKQTVIAWAETLDAFNNSGHCE